MIRMLVSALLFFASAAVGLLAANAILDDVTITTAVAFFTVVLIFAIVQAVLAPFVFKVTRRNAPALVGGVGLFTTFAALLLTTLVNDGLVIDGVVTWFWATLVVWLVTMLASLLLPLVVLKKAVTNRREE
ncbi:hypothetical protein [Actinotalea sp.]|uniref:hypothetical protein n=1 Tax=Actinotalea sp. TaxID=1872145 RepID=UPI002C7FBD0F|nr:hypothetical protein [Actinotalea sp.]HQY32483.1 phage holin family protein [Actinotalea sp.]HRA50076.1 phage holin family protein [Actinotalea sp.]